LTHPITDSIPIYFLWHPGTTIEQTANYSDNQCVVHRLSGTHTGTHVDAPVYLFEGMNSIDEYDLNLWMHMFRYSISHRVNRNRISQKLSFKRRILDIVSLIITLFHKRRDTEVGI
jgi:kynurenine formamidase